MVGRDHAGVGNYYGEYDAQKLCIKYESELGIKIVKVRGRSFFCKSCKKITNDEICKNKYNRIEVSGTKIRHSLKNNIKIDEEFKRTEIIKIIKKGDILQIDRISLCKEQKLLLLLGLNQRTKSALKKDVRGRNKQQLD